MSMAQGFKVESKDVTDLIKQRVDQYLQTATNGGVGTVPTGQSTGVSWTSTASTVKTKNNNEISKFSKTKLDADEIYNLIIRCMWNACCVYWQKFSYYPYTSGSNNNPPQPAIQTETYRGVLSTMHVDEAEYKANYPQSSFIQNPYNIPVKSQLVKPFGLSYILDILISYNTSLETTIDHGCRNSCYSSCHSSCHWSSRSRR